MASKVLFHIGSGNGLLPILHQAIIRASADLLSNKWLWWHFCKFFVDIVPFSLKKMHFKMVDILFKPGWNWNQNCKHLWSSCSCWGLWLVSHYSDIIMSVSAAQITSTLIVSSAFCSGTYQRKHQSITSLAFVIEIHQRPLDSPHKGSVMWKMSPFDDFIMLFEFLYRYITALLKSVKWWIYLSYSSIWHVAWTKCLSFCTQ